MSPLITLTIKPLTKQIQPSPCSRPSKCLINLLMTTLIVKYESLPNGIHRFYTNKKSNTCFITFIAILNTIPIHVIANGITAYFFKIQLIWIAGINLIIWGLLYLANHYIILSESVLVLPNIGVQLETKYKSGYLKKQFYRIAIVQKVFIHEAIQFLSVLNRLVFIIDGYDSLVIAFPNSNLRHADLVFIYRKLDKLLNFDSDMERSS